MLAFYFFILFCAFFTLLLGDRTCYGLEYHQLRNTSRTSRLMRLTFKSDLHIRPKGNDIPTTPLSCLVLSCLALTPLQLFTVLLV